MMLKLRADLLNVKILYPFHKYDGMGIAHGYTCHVVFRVVYHDGSIHYRRSVCRLLCGFHCYRHLCRSKDGISHVHLYQRHLSSVRGGLSLHGEFQIFYFSGADDGNVLLVRQSLVVDIFCHATDAVAAHLRTAAVRIVHFHLKIRFFRRIDKDHTVAADSEMSIT